MILAFDTYYFEDKAKTVAIQFEDWKATEVTAIFEETLTGIANYEPGSFYKRELPCILSLLKQIDLKHCEAIVIDGFVILSDQGDWGLGGHLYAALKSEIPVIGVAKNDFSKIDSAKTSVIRGKSKKPLYITTKGIDLEVAATNIREMSGDYRMPDLLKQVDAIGRGN